MAMDWAAVESLLATMNDDEKRLLIGRVRGSLSEPAPSRAESPRRRLYQMLEDLDRLPVNNPADGFSSDEHDQILYGPSV